MTIVLTLLTLVLTNLVVQGGSGSGTYKCGEPISIKAPAKVSTYATGDDGIPRKIKDDLVFAKWLIEEDVIIDKATKNKATIILPCREQSVVSATYRAKEGK